MRLLHDLAKTHATFDDPDLVSRAGLSVSASSSSGSTHGNSLLSSWASPRCLASMMAHE